MDAFEPIGYHVKSPPVGGLFTWLGRRDSLLSINLQKCLVRTTLSARSKLSGVFKSGTSFSVLLIFAYPSWLHK